MTTGIAAAPAIVKDMSAINSLFRLSLVLPRVRPLELQDCSKYCGVKDLTHVGLAEHSNNYKHSNRHMLATTLLQFTLQAF